jgi:predicted adenine nucleotide alpha hydrolase (AANH) superfamily ATPase
VPPTDVSCVLEPPSQLTCSCSSPDLGRTPNWVNNEFSQNNTLVSISYWKSIEDLEAFGRRPVHVKSMMFLNAAFRGPKGHTLGVMVRECNQPFIPSD